MVRIVRFRHLLALVIGLAGLWASAGPAAQRPVFRSGLDLVNVGATVTDRKGKLAGNLAIEDFEILEDGQRQEIAYFAAGAGGEGQAALHLGIMLDISGSMDEDLRTARTASIKFLGALPTAEDFTVVDFDTEVRVAQFSRAAFPQLVERIRSRKAEGYTALYDAVGVYLDTANGQQGRKVLLVYSDGGDNSSRITFSEMLDLLKASDVTVYPIGFLEHASQGVQFELRMQLQQMADTTGGSFTRATSMKEIEAAYERVRAEIAAQYTLGYVSTNPKTDGTWRKIEVKLRGESAKDLRVRSRKGYYAPLRQGGRGAGPDGGPRS